MTYSLLQRLRNVRFAETWLLSANVSLAIGLVGVFTWAFFLAVGAPGETRRPNLRHTSTGIVL